MRDLSLLVLLASACGGAAGDPCAIDATGLDISSKTVAELAITADTLECNGTGAGAKLDCTGAVTVTAKACSDGFGYVVAASGTKILLRFKGGDSWTAGGQIDGAEALKGSISYAGLLDPMTPVPESGRKHAGAFACNTSAATVTGKLSHDW